MFTVESKQVNLYDKWGSANLILAVLSNRTNPSINFKLLVRKTNGGREDANCWLYGTSVCLFYFIFGHSILEVKDSFGYMSMLPLPSVIKE